MMSMRFLFSRIRRALVGAGLLLLVALAVACGGGGGGSGGNGGNGNGGGPGSGGPGINSGQIDAPRFLELPASSVTVAATADDGNAVLTIKVADATLPPFARSGFRSDGGETATISLASNPVDIFTFDNAVAPLVLAVTNSVGAATATIRFVSAPRFFTDDLLSISVAALDADAGATILAAGAASISIWHNGTMAIEEYDISPDDGNFGVDLTTGLVTAATNLTSGETYDLNLSLTDNAGYSVSRLLRVTVGALFVDLPASPVVAAAVDVGDAILTITVAGATLQSFARSGFRSDGGDMATISLVSDPVSIFTFDNAVVSLTITLSDSRRTIAATVRFVSAPRVIAADLLSISVAALEAVAGEAILAAGEAKISIWHNDAADEEYKISPDDGDFGVDSATGLVTAMTNLTPDATYNLTLHLIDRALSLTASRSLRVTVGALPPLEFVDLPASSVVVAADADIGDAILTITAAGAALPSFARSGFMSNGGETATIALASIPADIFTLDYAVASLAFTLSDRRRTVAATVRFVSAPRAVAAESLRIPVAALEAVAGVTILAADAAEISIWHNDAAAVEEYKISPDDGNFGVDSATGLVTATTDLTPDETYNLTLHLIDRGLALTATRSLQAVVGALPLLEFVDLPTSSVVVAAAADIGDAILTITAAGAALPSFARSGFRSDGGETATIALASIPADIFTLDYAVASLALTLSDRLRTVAATVRFVSAPRVITADLLRIPVAALEAIAGATILAAGEAKISIWHNDAGAVEEYDISPDDGNFGVDSSTGLVTAMTDLTPDATYNLTLHLIDRGLSLTASRSLQAVVGALPPLEFVGLSASSSVVIAAAADIGDAVLTITVAGATLPSFTRSGFRSDGGALATIALTSIPVDIFTLDYAVASLAFTLSDRRQTVAATVRFVSAPRAVAADLLSISVAALEAVVGATILAAGAADISIWHNDAAAVEEYKISPDDGDFGVDSSTGLVMATTNLTPDETYNLTLHLIDRALALTASRSLRAVVGVLPPLKFVDLPVSSVVVSAAADIGDAVLTITVAGATLPSFARSGFMSDGGETATIALASNATVVFDSDNAVALLSFTLSDRRRTVAATIRFVSALRVITDDLLRIPVAAFEAVAGATILAAGAAEISIWHNGAEAIEEYDISPDDGNFGVDSAMGLVTAATDLTPSTIYNLNLSLTDNAHNAVSRSLRVTVGALLPLGFLDLPASPIVAAADAGVGDAVLTITVAGAALPPFARSGFMSDGGETATIALASEATVVFDSDNAVASLALTLAGGAETATATIRFVSAPRVIAPAPATIFVSFIDAVAGGTILATGAAGVSIWHNGAGDRYEISSAGGFFGVDSATGLVTAAMDLTIGDSYDFTLRVIDDALSLTASRSLRAAAVNLGPLQSRYLSTVEWSVVNAYDYLVEQDGEMIDLRVVGGVMTDGATRETAFPIYNIWQLQAIDGLRGNPFSSSFLATATLFGANANERLGRHYRLMNDIDAGPTRRWAGGMGFHPIGDSEPQRAGLRGGLYGDGYAIRNLWIDRPYSLRVGLFAVVDGGVIDSVGIEDARIAGLGYVGALVGEQIGGVIQNAWASGAVAGDGWRIGGLVGRNDGGVIFDSWTRSDVRGDRRVGGLVGAVDIRNIGGVRTVPVIERGQAMGNVRGNGDVGGLVGRNGGGMISESRSFATVTGEGNIGGLIGSSFAGDIGFNGSTGPVRGNINVGGLVGRHVRAAVAGNWSIAAVTGKENVGGLVGNITSDGAVTLNWSAGSARGDFGVGGLIGRNRHAEVGNNWSVASASGEQFVGGLLGRVENANDITDHVQDNWSGGAIAAQNNGGGMLGYARRAAIPRAYWSEETSGTTFSWGFDVRGFAHRGIPSMQESTASLFESDDWHNGDSDLSDNAADFPVLAALDIGLQWAGLAYGLTRVLAAADGAEMAEWDERREMSRGAATIRIDTNAMASDTRAEVGVTSTPDCALVDGVLRAMTNYNGAVVLARAEGGVLSSANGCEAVLIPNAGARRATLHLAFVADGATMLRRAHEMRYFDAGDLDARADFLASVEWSKAYAQGDEDGDGIPNAYDYRPRGDSFDLRFDEAGDFYDFWPIYNVWQLQAIDGETPGYAGGEDLFGVLEPIRLGGRYRLMNDIDAGVTEEWPGGFAPIGDYHSSFSGEFMGGGNVVRNLRIDRANDFRAGLFAHLTGEVRGLGMTGRVVGDYEVGGLVGYMSRGLLSDSWSLAAVSGALWVGGLAGRQGGGRIERSWSSGRVRAEIDGGGLVGDQAGGAMVNSWSSGSVESDYDAGGLVGDQTFDAGIATTWSAGSASATAIGGAAGGLLGSSFGFVAESYWSEETSGRLRSAAGDGVATAQTLLESEWNISEQIWNFGDGELSDGDGDFPVLSGLSEEWQATGLGLGLARVLAVNGASEIALRSGETNIVDEAAFAALRLDANGLAADDGGDRTSSPSCRFVAGTLEAETNYNGATLRLRLLPTTAGELRAYDSGRCEVGFAVTESGAATLRVESSSGSARAHFDYPLDLRALLSPPSPVDESGGAALSIYAPRRLLLPSRAEAGYVALTASVSAGAIEASSRDGFSTGGGAVAFVTLTAAATAAFATDGARLIFALAATASGGRAATATAVFGSRPLALDGGITTVSLRALRAVSGRLLLSALSVSARVKHYEGERYRLANDYGGLFAADPESGEIRLSRRVDAAVDAVLELRAEGGGVAGTQSLRVQAPAALASEGRNCELGQQWRCRDEFYAILTAAIAAGEATLNDNQAVVLDSGNHGRSVLNVFAEFGSGAVVAFHEFLNNRILTPRAYFLSHATFDTGNKKPIINHSVTGAYERFVGLDLSVFNRRDAIFVQSSGNSGNFEPDYHLFNGSHFDRERAEAIAETGRLVVVGGYQLISEQPNGDLSIGLVFSGCGFAKEYCLIAEGIGVPPGNLSGTSFAAPQVAAALQMLATMWPELSQDSLVSLLLALASDVTLSGAPETVGVDAATGHGLLSFRRLFSADGAMGFKCSIVENACVSDYF